MQNASGWWLAGAQTLGANDGPHNMPYRIGSLSRRQLTGADRRSPTGHASFLHHSTNRSSSVSALLPLPSPSWRHEGPAARGGGAAPAAPRLGDATRRLRIGGAHLGHDHDRNGGAVIAPSLLQDAHGPVSCRNDLFKALN